MTTLTAPAGRMTGPRQSVAGAWCGLGLALSWAPMAVLVPLFPDLDSPTEVETFWRDHGLLTQIIMVSVVAGYPLLLMFLADLTVRAARGHPHSALGWAALAAGLMFTTGLTVALGLAAAAGLVADQDADASTAHGLHVGAFVLAAPFTGAGVAFFIFVGLLAHHGRLGARWLRWPALIGILGNAGAIGGLFTLTGPANSGNGILGGILLPLGTFLAWIVCASCAWLRDHRNHPSTRT